jgi:hypothetical protein
MRSSARPLWVVNIAFCLSNVALPPTIREGGAFTALTFVCFDLSAH